LYFRDYLTRTPSQAELLDVALTKLRGFFRTVQYENPFVKGKADPTGTLGGQPSWIVPFQATEAGDAGMFLHGKVYLMTARGYAYWLFTWGPGESDLLEPHWAKVRQSFRLLDARPGWTEKPRETILFRGTLAPYQLAYIKDLWTAETDPRGYDPSADLVLRGFEKGQEASALNKAAILQILVLPGETDLQSANLAAHQYLLKRQQEIAPAASMAPVINPRTNQPEWNGPTELGAFRGHLSKLILKRDRDHQRFAWVAVVPLNKDGSVVFFGECPWERREYWDNEFQQVADHLAKADPAKDRRAPRKD
jgi:hypothetical protein